MPAAARRPAHRSCRAVAVVIAVVGFVTAGCTSVTTAPGATSSAPATSTRSPSGTTPAAPTRPAVAVAALARGERWITLGLPGGTYTPRAESGGTDDYRCMLLDPRLTRSAFLSGVVLRPGNPALVHHAILYRVDPSQVAAAQAQDAADPRTGWSCFGGPGVSSGSTGAAGQLDAAPWVAAFATTGGEQRFGAGTGEELAAGSRLILQMHYNLLNGTGTDNTLVRLRVANPRARLQPLQTLLLPAPVELPCAPTETGPLCDRTASVYDVARRFGSSAGVVVAGLQLICGGSVTAPRAGATQSCARAVPRRMRIRAVAGHMHLLGRSIRVDLLRAGGGSRTLLDTRVWNFDDQRASVLARPVTVGPGDRLRVTCTHDASLRARLPELRRLPPRYVVWGEGSSDEMCLGIVSYTAA